MNSHPKKTIFVHFNNKNILPGQTEIQIGDYIVKSSEFARFLGVTFDYKLTFSHHVAKVKQKCAKAINIIKFLCGTWWGAHPDTLLTLYKSYVRSIMEYGSFIYFPTRKAEVQKIERIQYEAIRAALGLRKSTPVNILLAESKLQYIEHRAQYLGYRYLCKTFSNLSSPLNKTLSSYYEACKKTKRKKNRLIKECCTKIMLSRKNLEVHSHYNIYRFEYASIMTKIPVDFDLGLKLKHSENPNAELRQKIDESGALAIFTDGSKIPGNNSVGAAAYCPELNLSVSKSLNKKSSIFSAECLAIYEAIKIAMTGTDGDVFILSDSQSVLSSLNSAKMDIKLHSHLLKIEEKHTQLKKKGRSVHFFWIPAHLGIEGNEEADRLAKEAIEELSNKNTVHFSDLLESFKLETRTATVDKIVNEGENKGKFNFQNLFLNRAKP